MNPTIFRRSQTACCRMHSATVIQPAKNRIGGRFSAMQLPSCSSDKRHRVGATKATFVFVSSRYLGDPMRKSSVSKLL